MLRFRSTLVVAIVLLLPPACNAGGVGSASLNTAQTVLDLTDAVVGLQQREAEMQMQLDSLQRTVARQDTLITRLSAAAGMSTTP